MAIKADGAIQASAVPEVTGYATDTRLYATRYKQGGRTVYSLDLSLAQIQSLIQKPDPTALTPGNRAIRPNHALGFAKYIRAHENWVAPAMILRSPDIFHFDILQEVEGTEFGIVSFPRHSSSDIRILDGQHRTLGIHLADEGIAADLDKARSLLASARRVDPQGAAVREAQGKISDLEKQRARLVKERLSLQIFVEDDPAAYKQMFFDIADNALGITSSVKSRFDARKVVNRSLEQVLTHPLLLNRVDLEADRIGRGSQFFMGAKHVAEIVKSVQVGLDGRVSRRQDAEWKESEIAKKATVFLDLLVDAFPPLKAMVLGQILPDDLRKSSLLGSVLLLRALAGTYHDLKTKHAFEDGMIRDYFAKLNPHMTGPVYEGSIWLTEAPPGLFSIGGFAPTSRRQDLKSLNDTLVSWAVMQPDFLDAPPAPRPPAPVAEEDEADYGSGYTLFGADVPKA
jgi:hypothetical protein